MDFLKQNVGIDVDSKELKVSLQWISTTQEIKIKASRTFKNTTKGFTELMFWIEAKKKPGHPVHITMEATGVYYENLAFFFYEQENYTVHVVLPNMSAAYFKSLNVKTKNDEIDARTLGQMGLERKLNPWEPGSLQMRSIKKLTRERLRLQTEKTMVSNQLHAKQSSYMPNASSIQRYKERIQFLGTQLDSVEVEITNIVESDKELNDRITNVTTAIGVGFITAIGVVAEMNGFTLFKNKKQVVSYAGYDVVENQSGKTVGKTKISKKGNSYIRRILYMPAMAAVNHDNHHKQYYQRIFDNTKIKMKGYVAIQRKLLVLIYTLYTKNVPFDPLYQQKIEAKKKAKQNREKADAQQKKRQKFANKIDEICRPCINMAYAG